MGDFTKLQVWLDAKSLAVQIYNHTKHGEVSTDFGFRDQMRRAAVSVASNIAEGEESGRSLKAINYFYISKGSLAELETQILIAREIGYFEVGFTSGILNHIDELSKKLRKLIQYREKNINK